MQDNMKPYFRRKGKYKDNRQRIIIEWINKDLSCESIALPKPEKLLEILSGQVILDKKRTAKTKEKLTKNSRAVRDTLTE